MSNLHFVRFLLFSALCMNGACFIPALRMLGLDRWLGLSMMGINLALSVPIIGGLWLTRAKAIDGEAENR